MCPTVPLLVNAGVHNRLVYVSRRLHFAAKTDPTTVIAGPATPNATGQQTQPAGTPLITRRMHKPADEMGNNPTHNNV